jgi:hypothetical protein
MATQLLAPGTTAADSADITASAGTPVTLFLKGTADGPADSGALCEIKVKDTSGFYHKIGELNGRDPGKAAVVIDGPGTYRVSRIAGASCGVDQG